MPTYKGIEMPTNNADKIGAMIESAKNKLMGTPVGDFVRGVGAVGTIPNTIVAGTQNSYGANIPTVEGLKQNLTASVEQGNIASDVGTGVSRIFNNANTPTFGATVNQPLPNMVKEGAAKSTPADLSKPNNGAIKDERSFNWPLASGISMSKPESGLGALIRPDYKTREDIAPAIASSSYNPNDAKFSELMNDLLKTAATGDPSVSRATKINSLKTALQNLAPMTSYGQFGVTGIQADTARRGQEITAGVTTRGQDTNIGIEGLRAETTRRGQDIEGAIKKPYYEANAEESKAKSRLYGTQTKLLEEEGKPDKVREKEVSGWLTERQKVINAALEGIADMTPEEKEKHMATLKADFNKHNPAPPRKAKQNADGTVTVEFADGRVVTGKPKK
jgi:hypothetical protein